MLDPRIEARKILVTQVDRLASLAATAESPDLQAALLIVAASAQDGTLPKLVGHLRPFAAASHADERRRLVATHLN